MDGFGPLDRLVADARVSLVSTARAKPLSPRCGCPAGGSRSKAPPRPLTCAADTMLAVCLRHVPRAVIERGARLAATRVVG
jgi:hypothetical protein